MGQIVTIGLDIAKSVFQVHGVDESGAVIVRRQVRRAQLLAFSSRQRGSAGPSALDASRLGSSPGLHSNAPFAQQIESNVSNESALLSPNLSSCGSSAGWTPGRSTPLQQTRATRVI